MQSVSWTRSYYTQLSTGDAARQIRRLNYATDRAPHAAAHACTGAARAIEAKNKKYTNKAARLGYNRACTYTYIIACYMHIYATRRAQNVKCART